MTITKQTYDVRISEEQRDLLTQALVHWQQRKHLDTHTEEQVMALTYLLSEDGNYLATDSLNDFTI